MTSMLSAAYARGTGHVARVPVADLHRRRRASPPSTRPRLLCYGLASLAEPALHLIERALAGDAEAIRALVDTLTPVIQARVARGLRRRRDRAFNRDVAQEVEDMTQEVFLALFDDDGKNLRAWSPERGLSLANFVGLVAERQVASILRTGRRSPWTEDPTASDALDVSAGAIEGHEDRVFSRELFTAIVARLRTELSPKGLQLFYMLVVDELTVETICAQMEMQADAVYAWRSRLAKLVRRIGAELQDDPVTRTTLPHHAASPRGSS